jgi:hypothetical protein
MISITYLTRLLDHILRDPDRPLRLGQQIRLTTADIEITALSSEGLPAEATFRFAVPLDDPSLRWVTTRGFSYVPFEPPAVGQTVRVPNPLD